MRILCFTKRAFLVSPRDTNPVGNRATAWSKSKLNTHGIVGGRRVDGVESDRRSCDTLERICRDADVDLRDGLAVTSHPLELLEIEPLALIFLVALDPPERPHFCVTHARLGADERAQNVRVEYVASILPSGSADV